MVDQNTRDIITLTNRVENNEKDIADNRQEIKEVKGWFAKVVWFLVFAIISAGLALIFREGLI